MTKETDRRFVNLGRKITLFILGALLLISILVFLIGRNRDLFTHKYELSFTVPKGTGFTIGMPVKLSGFRIGRIKSISLNEQAAVDIVLQINREYGKWIRGDSRAKLVKEGLVGETIVEVTVGTPSQPLLADNGRIFFEKTTSLEEMADEISEKVKPVLIEVRDIIGYINDPNGDVKQSIRNIRRLSGNLEMTRGQVDMLLSKTGNDIGDVSVKLRTTLDNAALSVRKADRSLTQLEHRLPGILEKADRTLENLEEASDVVKKSTKEVLPRLPAILDKGERSLKNAEQVIDAVKGTWPISSRIPKPGTAVVPGDSHE